MSTQDTPKPIRAAKPEPPQQVDANPAESIEPPLALSLRDVAFVANVLIPRAWVCGDEVDALVSLRARLSAILEGARHDAHA